MHRNEAALRRARDARALLATIDSHERPCGADPFDWSADLLDELVRLALDLAEISATLAGDPDGDVGRRAGELATAIVRRRNAALRAPIAAPRTPVASRAVPDAVRH